MIAAGTRLGPYEILAPIGAGGMGEVYRARDPRLDRDVAVKILPEHLSSSPERLARFVREAKAVAALTHPNVVAVHDLGTHNGTPYAVMDLLAGQTLRQRLAAGPMTWPEARAVGIAIADGVAAAHAKGIVHRDLKPENVMLTTDGQVKVLDFGLARQELPVTPQAETGPFAPVLTQTGAIMGTPGYMPPEQVRGESADARADVFALGCVLYEMVAGRAPFRRQTRADTMAATLTDTPPPPGGPAAAVILRCLEKTPADRFPSARELGDALRAAVGTPPASPRTRSGMRRIAAVALVVLVVAGVVVVGSLLRRGTPPGSGGKDEPAGPVRVAVLPVSNDTGQPEHASLADFLCEDLIGRLTVQTLDVKSFASVAGTKGGPTDPQDVGRRLGVEKLVTGRLRLQDGQPVVSVSLVDARTGSNVWSDHYPVTAAGVATVNERVARRVTERLGAAVTPAEGRRLARRLTDSADAMRLYLKGRELAANGNEKDVRQAIAAFHKAADADPRFALPHLGLASAHYWMSNLYEPPSKAMPEAKKAAAAAIERDDDLGDAHALLGFVRAVYDWDWAAADADFQRALDRSPRSATVRTYHGLYLISLGRLEEALGELRRTQELDPLTPEMVGYPALALYFAGRHEQAIRELRDTLRRAADAFTLYAYLGLCHEQRGEWDEAIKALETVREKMPNPDGLGQLGHAYARAGRPADARKVLDELHALGKKQYVSSYNFALLYLALGEPAAALDSLEKAVGERADWVAFLNVDPRLKPLHAEPRFRALLRKVRLAP